MIGGASNFLRMMVETIRGNETPRQLAFGIACGMLLGLVPKDNLLSVILATLIVATRVNLFTATCSAFFFSWIGFVADPQIHLLGMKVLNYPGLQQVWAFLYDLPLVPWTRFNNTVVAGSLFTGICFFFPVYITSEFFFREFGAKIHDRLSDFWMYQKLAGIGPKQNEIP